MLGDHLTRGSLDDALIRDAVCYRLEVAIDAVAKVNRNLLDTEVPDDWPKIIAMRNMLAHQYSDLDQEILQNTIDNRLDKFVLLVERHPVRLVRPGFPAAGKNLDVACRSLNRRPPRVTYRRTRPTRPIRSGVAGGGE